MKNKNVKCLAVLFSLIILFMSCNKGNVYDELPVGKDLTVAYEKLLKLNELEEDSSFSFVDIGASFVVYPNNEVEKNQASVYVTVYRGGGVLYKYIYNMTTDKHDSYKVGVIDPETILFAHQIFPSFEKLDIVRDSLLIKGEFKNPQISNIRFHANSILKRIEIEAIVEDVDKPGNSQVLISDLDGNITQ